ncbi:hypothetical protein ABZ826_03835 [Streptomyces sp. NPDC047515]
MAASQSPPKNNGKKKTHGASQAPAASAAYPAARTSMAKPATARPGRIS